MSRDPAASKLSGRECKLLSALILADCTAGIETTLVLTALAKLAVTFGDPAGVSWLLTGYLLMAAASAALAPGLGDALGRKRVLLIVLMLCLVGSVVSAVSTNLSWVIAGRVLQGCSGALLPLCIGLAREQLEPEHVDFGIGVLAGVASLSAALGFLLAGWLVDNAPWQYLFVTGGGVAIIAATVGRFAIAPSVARLRVGNLDLLGGLLFAPAIALILLSVSKVHDWNWMSPTPWAVPALALAMLLIWVRREMAHPRPLIDVRLLQRRGVLAANMCVFVAGLGALQPQLMLALLQQPQSSGIGLGLSATGAAAVMATGQLLGAGASVLCGQMARRIGGVGLLLLAAVLLLAGWAGIFVGRSTIILAVLGYIVVSLGIGALMTGVAIVVVSEVPASRTSESSGLTSISRAVGTALGAQIVFAIFAAHSTADHRVAVAGYEWAFVPVLSFCAINLIIGLTIAKLGKKCVVPALA
ncbi:MFS transporter [Rhizorhabdus wittichii]|uniref:MFS transporter n=1 Tax=Rhizorhabdus wittichii TaxID=160791 RepID=UPI0002E92AFA|nr:MFS transporter [Rhizorhabdus wittichii]